MVLGNTLRERDQQYVANKDESTKTWRILDTWHDDLRNLTVDDDINDDSPALTILTEGAFIALVREAARLGVLQNATFTGEEEIDTEELEIVTADLSDKSDRITELEEENTSLKKENFELLKLTEKSEEYALKDKAMQSILQLVSMSEMANLSKD